MNFLGLLQRRGKRGSSEKEPSEEEAARALKTVTVRKKPTSTKGQELLHFDLFYQISYMSAISMAGISRDRIFEYSSQLPDRAAVYFRDIQQMCTHLGYDYAEACRLEGESVEDESVRSLLLRLAGTLSAGESEADFFAREADVLGINYTNTYERKLASLKQWTDAFCALIVAAALIIIIGVVSTMIWKTDMIFVMALVALSVGINITGAWLISLMSPKEMVTLRKPSSREQRLARKLFTVLLPAALIAFLLLTMSGAGLGWIMLVSALIVFPIGHVTISDDKGITKKDEEIGAFLRSLGGVATAIGTTVTDAIGRLDLRSVSSLSSEATSLKVRLQTGILTALCWRRFVLEVGSVIVNRSVGMFRDAMALGAEAMDAGNRASSYAVTLSMLRAQRKMISKPFTWLVFCMHGAVILLMVLVTEVMNQFGTTVGELEQDIPGATASSGIGNYFSFSFAGIELLNTMVIPLILVLTVVNAMATKIVDGGHNYKFFYYLAITMGISGVFLICIPYVTAILFGSVG